MGPATRDVSTPQPRFAATRPMYAQLEKAGLLRRIIPMPFGGDGTGIRHGGTPVEFYRNDLNVSLTMLALLAKVAHLPPRTRIS